MPPTDFLLSYASQQTPGLVNGVELDAGSYALNGCVATVFRLPILDSNE